jgi:hypothetical protein
MMVFQCPQCHTLHEEPLEASYLLGVRCVRCYSEAEPLQTRRELTRKALDAAWASVTRAPARPLVKRRKAA